MENKKTVENEEADPTYIYIEENKKDYWHYFWNIFWVCVAAWFVWAIVTDDLSNDQVINEPPQNDLESKNLLEENLDNYQDLFNIDEVDSEDLNNLDEVNSKYLHFTNLEITFSMKGLEAKIRRQRMYNALEIIEKEIGEFSFIEIDDYENANIKIYFPKRNNLDTIGETTTLFNDNGNIEGGEITMINVEKEGCDEYPDTEIHEILHVFGFDHNPKTIMKEYARGCQPLHSEWSIEYVEHLKFIYSNGELGIEHPELPSLLETGTFSACDDGWYDVVGSDEWCCPEPNMYADDEGYCY